MLGRRRPPRLSRTVVALVIVALVPLGLGLAVWQPWQHLRKVLSAPVPRSHDVIELWEKADWRLGLGSEYETWFVVRSAHEKERWHLIDAQYITFRNVTLLASSDRNRVRVETDGEATGPHMIGEYDFGHDAFRSASGPTVRNTRGWTVLCEAQIH